MKQTVEEAAREYRVDNDCRTRGIVSPNQILYLMKNAFKDGAEWQAKQSPWISVKDRLPEDDKENIIHTKSGLYITKDVLTYSDELGYNVSCRMWRPEGWFWSGFDQPGCVVAWMSIPSFDQILEANKDVLQRLKEKGD